MIYCNTVRLPADVIWIVLWFTTIQYGYQLKLTVVYYIIYYNTVWLPADVNCCIQWYTTIQYGYQPALSILCYDILQYSTATSRRYLQYTMIYCNKVRLPANVICIVLWYTTTIQCGYQSNFTCGILRYTTVKNGYQPTLTALYDDLLQ